MPEIGAAAKILFIINDARYFERHWVTRFEAFSSAAQVDLWSDAHALPVGGRSVCYRAGSRGSRLWDVMVTFSNLLSLLRRGGYTHVLAVTVAPIMMVSLARIVTRHGGSLVFYFAGLGRLRILPKPIVGMLAWLLRKGDVAIVENLDDQGVLARTYGLPQVVRVPGAGVDPNAYQPAAPAKITPPEARSSGTEPPITLLFASRLLEAKGIVRLIGAMRYARRTDIRLLIAGIPVASGGLSARALESMIAADARITFLGQIDDVRSLFPGADACILPSSYGEGIPRILLEALYSGLPIITTDIPGCNEVCIPNVNGILLPAHITDEALGGVLEQLTRSTLSPLAARARDSVLGRYDDAVVIGQMMPHLGIFPDTDRPSDERTQPN
jgi:glycosyltransferase involved in cell wall biosynthesis